MAKFKNYLVHKLLWLKLLIKCVNPFNNDFAFSFKKSDPTGRMVYMSDGSMTHGGVTDRLKGLISCFYLANQKGLDFNIFYITPIKFENIWDHKKVNLDQLKINPFTTKIWNLNYSKLQLGFEGIKNLKYGKRNNLVYSNLNLLSYDKLNKPWQPHFKKLYDRFISMGDDRISSIFQDRYSDHITASFNVVHFRCLNYFGDFADSNLPEIPDTEQKILLGNIAVSLKNFIDSGVKTTIISDSRKLLFFLKDNGFDVFNTEPTNHLDEPGFPIENYVNGYLENYLLTKASDIKSIILYHRKKPFNSHFAYFASVIGGVPFKKYALSVNTKEIEAI